MKRFLILGHYEDIHAHYVAWALETAGYQVGFINSLHDNCPTSTTLYLDHNSEAFVSPDWNNVEAAWSRRRSSPLRSNKGKDENHWYTLAEEQLFTSWLIELQHQSRPIRWINSPNAALAGENKFMQLHTARSHGIDVPRTLVTAQPDRFRTFLKTEGTIVAKPLRGYLWEYASGVTLITYADILDAKRGAELSDEDIAQCVTMYQQRIEKDSDVRMLIMGRDIFAFKVIQEGEQHFDFRIGFTQANNLRYEQISIPASLQKKIGRFMDSMNINFASADFALTANGNFVFLDLNPSGQWLFIEAPEARVGEKFCSFFVNGRVDPTAENLFPSYSEFTETDRAKSMEKVFRQYGVANAGPTSIWKEKRDG